MNNQIIQQAKSEITPIEEQVTAIVVKDSESRELAISLRKVIKEGIEQIEEKYHFVANTKQAHKAWKDAKDTENAVYVPYKELDDIVRSKVTAFDREEAIKAQRIAREAEAKRLEVERKEREKLEAQARKAAEKGKVEKAEALKEMAENVTITPTFTPPQQPTKKLVWKCEVKNPLLLCQSISQGLIPTSVIQVAQAQLNAWAKTYDGKEQIPGLVFYQDVLGRAV